MLVHSALMLTI